MAAALALYLLVAADPAPSRARLSLHRLRGGLTDPTSPPLYRLRYFDARGVAELARVTLRAAGVVFEDARFPVAMVDGMPRTPEFAAAKESGDLAANMGRVPILDVLDPSGAVEASIGQSHAIERYVARAHGLLGGSLLEAAAAEALREHCQDIRNAYSKAVPPFSPDDESKAARKAHWYKNELPQWLVRLEGALGPQEGAGPWLVGQQMSLADLAVWQLLRDFFDDPARCAEAAAPCARLRAAADAVAAVPAVEAWVAERPRTLF